MTGFIKAGKILLMQGTVLCGNASTNFSSAASVFAVLFATFLVLVFDSISAMCLTFTIGRFPAYVYIAIVVLQVGGLLSLLLMMSFLRIYPCSHNFQDVDLQPWLRFLQRNIKLFGIVPSCLAIVVLDLFRILADGQCHDAWAACTSLEVRIEHFVVLVDTSVRIIYLFVVVIVCVKFSEARFHQNTLVLAGLAVVQAANLSVWLDTLIEDSLLSSSELNGTFERSRCFNGTSVNVSEHFDQCFRRKTSENELLEAATSFLQPFTVEYLLLVFECLAGWFFSSALQHLDETPQPRSISQQAESVSATGKRTPSRDQQSQLEFDAAISQVSSTDLLPRLDDHMNRATTTSVIAGSTVRCSWHFVFVVASSTASLLLVFFAVVNFFIGYDVYRTVVS